MMAEGIPPFGEASDRRGEPDDGPIEIRLYAKTGRYTKTMIRRVSLDHAEDSRQYGQGSQEHRTI